MAQTPMNTGAAAMDDAADTDSGDDGSYVIELTVKPDGTFTVEKESGADEEAEESGGGAEGAAAGGGEDDSGAQSFSDLKSALTCIMQTVKNNGQMPAQGADESAFQSGYGMKNGPSDGAAS